MKFIHKYVCFSGKTLMKFHHKMCEISVVLPYEIPTNVKQISHIICCVFTHFSHIIYCFFICFFTCYLLFFHIFFHIFFCYFFTHFSYNFFHTFFLLFFHTFIFLFFHTFFIVIL